MRYDEKVRMRMTGVVYPVRLDGRCCGYDVNREPPKHKSTVTRICSESRMEDIPLPN
jgi:hypothetical protein